MRHGSLNQLPALPVAATARGQRRLPLIARLLTLAGVARVRIEYEGHWGYAHIDLVTYHGLQDRELTSPLPQPRTEQLEEFFRRLLEERYPKWPQDEGAYGEFTWNISEDSLTHDHHRRYIAFEATHLVD